MVKKLTLSAAILVLLLAALPASLLYFLAYTEPGLQFIVARLPSRIGPVTMLAEGATGTVAGGLALQHFHLEHELVSIDVRDVRGRVDVLPLLWQSIQVQEAHVDSLRIEVHRRKTPPPPRAPRFLPGFLSIEIPSADLRQFTLVATNGTPARTHVNGAAPTARWDWLALETLMFGWQVAREDRSVASMIFAMPPSVADCIAALTTRQVRTLAIESAKSLRLRWDNHPRLWRELLLAAREPDDAALEALRREAKLHFCGESKAGAGADEPDAGSSTPAIAARGRRGRSIRPPDAAARSLRTATAGPHAVAYFFNQRLLRSSRFFMSSFVCGSFSGGRSRTFSGTSCTYWSKTGLTTSSA